MLICNNFMDKLNRCRGSTVCCLVLQKSTKAVCKYHIRLIWLPLTTAFAVSISILLWNEIFYHKPYNTLFPHISV